MRSASARPLGVKRISLALLSSILGRDSHEPEPRLPLSEAITYVEQVARHDALAHACPLCVVIDRQSLLLNHQQKARDVLRRYVEGKNPKAPAVTRLAEEEWGR